MTSRILDHYFMVLSLVSWVRQRLRVVQNPSKQMLLTRTRELSRQNMFGCKISKKASVHFFGTLSVHEPLCVRTEHLLQVIAHVFPAQSLLCNSRHQSMSRQSSEVSGKKLSCSQMIWCNLNELQQFICVEPTLNLQTHKSDKYSPGSKINVKSVKWT